MILKMKWICIGLLFLSLNVSAQNGVFDDYKYIIIPTKFEIQDKENDFQLNTLVRQLFKQEGFDVYMDTELLPDEYQNDPCAGLRVQLDKRFNILQTYITINMYNCKNKVVFLSEGSSREKDFRTGYHEAIRMAFRKVESANYTLNTNPSTKVTQENTSLSKEERIEMRKQTVRDQSDVFNFNGETLYFFPVDDNIHIYDANAYDIVAKLSPINKTMFIYNSDDKDGVMTKKENGDFELEYREAKSKQTKILLYELTKRAK